MTYRSDNGEASTTPVPWYARPRTLHSLRHRDWSILWMMGHLWHLNLWMEALVLGWLVLELTDSPFQVALVAALRIIPMGVLGLFFGSLGDRFPKRNVLIAAQAVSIIATVGLTVVLFMDAVQMWYIYVATILGGCAFAAYLPVRRAFTRELVPEGAVVNAMSLDAASLMGMSMIGRFLGGGLLELIGADGAFAAVALSYIMGLLLLFRISSRHVAGDVSAQRESVVKGLREGMAYALSSHVLRSVLIFTFIANALVYSSLQLTPVFARDVLEVGPGLLGLMSGMEGVGSLLGALALASIWNLKRLGPVFLLGTLVLSVSTFFFGYSTIFTLSVVLLFISGIGSAGFIAMQAAIPAAAARAEMRARAMGAVTVSMGWGTPLGLVYVGFLAEELGPQLAVEINALAAILILLGVFTFMPALRRFSGTSRASGGTLKPESGPPAVEGED